MIIMHDQDNKENDTHSLNNITEDKPPVQKQPPQEKLTFTTPAGEEVDVKIIRFNSPDLFIALTPPSAIPYIVAPLNVPPNVIVDFFGQHVEQIDGMRLDMKKRFEKISSRKCLYRTGDIAYVLGRPFQIRVYPLAEVKEHTHKVFRGQVTAKFSVDEAISLVTLHVVHPKNYDEARNVFLDYATRVMLNNANSLVRDFSRDLKITDKQFTIKTRALKDHMSSYEGSIFWLSHDLIPYPPDCLVYVLLKQLKQFSKVTEEEYQKIFERILPNWKAARQLLKERPEPFSLQ